jgi:HEAT repeat protein
MSFSNVLSLVIPLVFLVPEHFQANPDLADLVRRLGSESVEERNQAKRLLKEAGRAAVPALERAAKDRDAEVAARAQELLRVLKISETISPVLRREFPGVEERLAAGGDTPWTRVFLDAVETVPGTYQRKHPLLRGVHLEALVAPALRGAENSEDFIAICDELQNRPFPAAAPELLKRLKDKEVGQSVELTLSRFPYPSVVEALLPFLKDESEEIRMRAGRILRALRLPAAAPPLLGLLDDPDDQVKAVAIGGLATLRHPPAVEAIGRCLKNHVLELEALQALGEIGDKAAAPLLLPYLDHRWPLQRAYAARALGELGWKEAVPRIVAMLSEKRDDSDDFALSLVIRALGQLDAAEVVPKLRKFVQNRDSQVRFETVAALGALGDRESARVLVPLLDDEYASVSENARFALRQWKSKELVEDIMGLLKKPKPDSPLGLAIPTLADLGAREAIPAILPSLKAKEYYERAVAADALARLHSDAGVDTLLEQPGLTTKLISLNALRQPDLFKRLEEERLRENPKGRPLEVLGSLARQLGWKLVLSKRFSEEVLPGMLPAYYGNSREWGIPRPLEVLDGVVAEIDAECILDPGEIRLVSPVEAAEYWTTWQKERAK